MGFYHRTHFDRSRFVLLTQTFFVRFSHWVGAFLLTLAIISGLYMTNPYLPLFPMRYIRMTHLSSNALLTGLVLGRVYYAFATGDIKNFTFHRGDFRRFWQLMAYYFFLAKEKPFESTKYNVGQRVIYDSWVLAWFLLASSGMVLANPTHPWALSIMRLYGGLQTIRLMRYLLTVYFVSTIFVHIYLSVTTDPAKFQAIITGYVRVKDGKPEE